MNKVDLIMKEFPNVELDKNNFEYNFMISTTIIETYTCDGKDKIIATHLNHIISDMYEDGWCLLACRGEVKDSVRGVFLFQKAKETH